MALVPLGKAKRARGEFESHSAHTCFPPVPTRTRAQRTHTAWAPPPARHTDKDGEDGREKLAVKLQADEVQEGDLLAASSATMPD